MIIEETKSPCESCSHEEQCTIRHPELEVPEAERITSCDILNKFSSYNKQFINLF